MLLPELLIESEVVGRINLESFFISNGLMFDKVVARIQKTITIFYIGHKFNSYTVGSSVLYRKRPHLITRKTFIISG